MWEQRASLSGSPFLSARCLRGKVSLPVTASSPDLARSLALSFLSQQPSGATVYFSSPPPLPLLPCRLSTPRSNRSSVHPLLTRPVSSVSFLKVQVLPVIPLAFPLLRMPSARPSSSSSSSSSFIYFDLTLSHFCHLKPKAAIFQYFIYL